MELAGRHNFWEFGEGVDSARGVTAIAVCCRNSSCNSSCNAIARNGRRTLALFLLFECNSLFAIGLCEGTCQTCFECGRCSQVLQSHPLPISPLLSGVDKRVVSQRVVLADVPPERKPERGYIRMFPQNENRNDGMFACSPGTKTRTRVRSPKPPFYEPALLSPK